MDEHNPVEWTPASPPSRSKRVLFALQRHSFLLVCLVLLLGTAAFLLLYSAPPSDELDPEELERLVLEHQQDQQAPAVTTSLTISSEPTGATVLWDLDSVGTTPFHLPSVETGAYLLRLHHEGHASLDTVIIVRDGPVDLSLKLPSEAATRPETSSLASAEAPPEAEVASVPAPSQERARRTPATTSEPSASQTGLLTVTSHPKGASIHIDGSLYGTTPHTIPSIAAGTYEVTLRLEGYDQQVARVAVIADETAHVHEQLAPSMGTLIVTVKPWGTIYIDEVLHELDTDVQYQTSLPVGHHTVRVQHPTLGTREQAVRVRDDETTHVVIRMDERTSEAARHEQDPQQGGYR